MDRMPESLAEMWESFRRDALVIPPPEVEKICFYCGAIGLFSLLMDGDPNKIAERIGLVRSEIEEFRVWLDAAESAAAKKRETVQ